VVDRACGAGVGLMVTIATRRASWPSVVALAERHRRSSAPGRPPARGGQGRTSTTRPRWSRRRPHPKVVGIGESGLDYFYDLAPRDRQATSFRAHIRAARFTGLPLIVHTRDADDDTMALLEEEMAAGPFAGVIHCYSSVRRLAERAVAIGLYLGLGGILTFKRSDELRATVRDMPLDRLLLETDAPYLAPIPYRGKPNEPAYTAHTAKVLAEVRGLP
jgi:TatD DNase family protein